MITEAEAAALRVRLAEAAEAQANTDWLDILTELAKLSDAMQLDSGDWADADDETLLEQFGPYEVISAAIGCVNKLAEDAVALAAAAERARVAEEALRMVHSFLGPLRANAPDTLSRIDDAVVAALSRPPAPDAKGG